MEIDLNFWYEVYHPSFSPQVSIIVNMSVWDFHSEAMTNSSIFQKEKISIRK